MKHSGYDTNLSKTTICYIIVVNGKDERNVVYKDLIINLESINGIFLEKLRKS
jgi:hypothetical protein